MSPDEWCNAGIEAERRNDPKAIKCYSRALALKPDHQQAMFNLAACHLQRTRDITQAVALAERHHQLYPTDQGRRLLGLCRLEQGRTGEAINLLPAKESKFYNLMVSGGGLIDQQDCPCGCGSAVRWNPPATKPSLKPSNLIGLLNKPCKSSEMISVWAKIAEATTATFVAFALGGEGNHFIRSLYEQAIPADRLRLIDYCSRAEFLEVASTVGVMLDTHPYNGIATMRDCLHVGVPVVCWPGHQQSAVRSVIPSEFIAVSEAEYIRIAVGGRCDGC